MNDPHNKIGHMVEASTCDCKIKTISHLVATPISNFHLLSGECMQEQMAILALPVEFTCLGDIKKHNGIHFYLVSQKDCMSCDFSNNYIHVCIYATLTKHWKVKF